MRQIALGAAVAALYCVLCLALQPISYNIVQFRVSEALCVLAIFFPSAVPGLFVGCLLANLLGGAGILDVVFGSLATLLAAFLTWKLRKRPLLAILPAVVVNMVVIPIVLHLAFAEPLWFLVGSIGLSQAIVCFGLGYPLYLLLKRTGVMERVL